MNDKITHSKSDKNTKRISILKDMPVRKAILTMSLPVVFGMMVQVLYNLVDTWFIGRLNDAAQLAAANIASPVFIMQMAIAGIVGTGAASYISRCLGEDSHENANKTLSIGIVLAVVLGLILASFGLIFINPIVSFLGADTDVFPYAKGYSLIMIVCSPIVVANFAIGQLMRAEGAAMPSIVGMMIGTIINIILDPILIFVFKLGVQGAAAATVMGNLCALIYYIFFYAQGKSLVKFVLKKAKWESHIMAEIFKIGIPATLNQALMSFALIICNNLAGTYGTDAIAGMGISTKLLYACTFIFMGFGAGTQPLVGYSYGAKNFARVKSIIKNGLAITELIGVVFLILFGVFAPQLVGLFTNLSSVSEWGIQALRIQIALFVIVGPQMIANTSVQAFGKGGAALLISICRQGLFFMPLLFLFNHLAGFKGLMAAQPVADCFTALLALSILAYVIHKESKTQKREYKTT